MRPRGRYYSASRVIRPLSRNPAKSAAINDRGVALAAAGRFDEALACFERAVAMDGASSAGHANCARVLLMTGRAEEALAAVDRAITAESGSADAWNLRGQVLGAMSRTADALACFERALVLRPGFAEAAANRAIAQGALSQRKSNALLEYDAAAAASPAAAAVHVNRGNILFSLGRHAEALAAFAQAIALDPRHARALAQRGAVLAYLKRHDEAAADFERALALDPSVPALPGLVLHARANMCDWRSFDHQAARIVEATRSGACASSPLVMLAITDSAAAQAACARAWVAEDAPRAQQSLWNGERYQHARLRIAYLSSDFDEHAVAYLVAGAVEAHDRAKFEIVAFHTGPPSSTPMHPRMRAAFDRFHDAGEWSDGDLAATIRSEEIDVLVDLNGHTHGSRMRALALRPAPVCVSYLGFPGTLGAPYVDGAIADRYVLPARARAHWSERVVDLPLVFQANDGKRPLPRPVSRESAGLPARGTVFCAFGNTYKITPRMFDVWMGILRGVEGSVLWLLDGTPAVSANLRREAHERGVDPSRLFFAPRLPYAAHLSRLALADIFLDTFPFNGGATASDALWCGVPVVTRAGEAMSSRLAASLLHAVGMDELATDTFDGYGSAASTLALDAPRLAAVKAKLVDARAGSALFDSVGHCRELEAAYEAMVSTSSAA